MTDYDTTSEKRTDDLRPKYILLCVDADDRHWIWRTTDDRVLAVANGRLVRNRTLPRDESPEALLARIDADIGIKRQYYARTLAGALAARIEA